MGQTFPLGTSDFRLLREDESLYVDKTAIISQMEKDSRYITSFAFRDTLGLSEQSIKFILIMFFRYTDYYKVITEREARATPNQGGLVDLLLLKYCPEVQVEWMFELKYIKISKSILKKRKAPI